MKVGTQVVVAIDVMERLSNDFKSVAADCIQRDYPYPQCMIAFRGAAVERSETMRTMLREQKISDAQREAHEHQKRLKKATGVVLPPGLRR